MQKPCFKCGEVLPLSGFYKHPMMADGRLNKCKECTKADVQNNRKKRTEYYRDYDKMRYRRDAYRQDQVKRWSKSQSPTQRKVHHLTGNAIRDGRLQRPEGCWYCGTECKPEAHHSFYDTDHFDAVTWLCRSCHIAAHKITA